MDKLPVLYCNSPIGFIEIKGTEDGITAVSFMDSEGATSAQVPAILQQCKTELEEYFSGKRQQFSTNLTPAGTEFQKQVWGELIKIAYGKTTSYMALAKKLHNPGAVRAVGLANGRNPIGIIIPCHRVIGGDGSLTGYAGGLWRKKWLLEHEAKTSGQSSTLF